MITELRRKFGLLALFLYNDLAPEVVAILWRPNRFVAQPFSAMHSEFARPVDDEWNADSMVLDNMNDLMRETKMYTKDTVVSVKILENNSVKRKVHSRTHFGTTPTSKKKPAIYVINQVDNTKYRAVNKVSTQFFSCGSFKCLIIK